MRILAFSGTLLLTATLASAQVNVTSPAAGASASYRTAVLSWDPIPGAGSYRLEIDDDPNFASPEVDVVVAGTTYALSGETLRLNGRLSWAAYVRINGMRWDAGTFTPSFRPGHQWPTLAIDADSRVYLGYHAFEPGGTRVYLTSSSDWSALRRLSLPDTFNPWNLDLAVTPDGTVHANWAEQRWETPHRAHFYTNSESGWELVRVSNPYAGILYGGVETPFLVGTDGVEIYQATPELQRFRTTDGQTFERTVLSTSSATNASVGRDAAGNTYVVGSQLPQLTLYRSSDGWVPHVIGSGVWPSIAVAGDGTQHVLTRQFGAAANTVTYSNSLRGFATWTPLPVLSALNFQDILPLVLDEARGRLHTAIDVEGGVAVCSSDDIGWTWTCKTLPAAFTYQPEAALAPDGTLHVAWVDFDIESTRIAYANSLGSFVATNFAPEVSFGTPISSAGAISVATRATDVDKDPLSGQVRAGRYELQTSLLAPGGLTSIVDGRYSLRNEQNFYLRHPEDQLLFQAGPHQSVDYYVYRHTISSFPATVEVLRPWNRVIGTFTILSWDDEGARISQTNFVPYASASYTGALPFALDISSLPAGDCIVRVTASDGTSVTERERAFVKAAGQVQLILSALGDIADDVDDEIDELDPADVKNANQIAALRNKLQAVVKQVQQALAATDIALREAMLADALAKLRGDILTKTDGCAVAGAPDNNDWITTCSAQQPLYATIQQLIAFVEGQ